MRIARFAAPGADPKFGLVELQVDGGEHPDTVATLTADPLAGPVNLTGERTPLSEVRLLAPVLPRSKVIGVGRNYPDHAAELGNQAPTDGLYFLKPNTSVIGPGEAIVRPSACKELHYEGELAVIIGRICKEVPIERAADVIFGYTVANDVTARDWQNREGQWFRAKAADTFCPIGPWIVTHFGLDEAADLRLRTYLDNELRQDGRTSDMSLGIAQLISDISAWTTLLPGDVILTGTPAGVGAMAPGQRVRVAIDGLGELGNPVVAGDQ